MLSQVYLHQIDALPMAVGAAALTVIAVFWLYPVQVRAAAGAFGWMLPILRSLALLALAAVLLKPVLLRPRSERERGAVLVLLDRSRSMSVTDNARTPAQLVAIADGLGRLKPGVRSSAGADLRLTAQRLRPLLEAAAAARDDLHFARASGVGADAALRRADAALAELDTAATRAAILATDTRGTSAEVGKAFAPLRSLKLPAAAAAGDRTAWAADVRARIDAAAAAADKLQAATDEKLYQSDEPVRKACETLSKLSRLQLAEEALLRAGDGLVPRLMEQGPVYGFGVATDVLPISLTRAGEAKPSLGVEAAGHHSDLAGVVAETIDRSAGQPVRAIVLISDGRQVGGDGALAAGVGARGGNGESLSPPVFTVAVSPPDSSRDLSIERIDYQSPVFAGETALVRVQLRASGGLRDVATTVRLRAGEVEQVQPVNLAAGGPPAVEFQLRVDKPALRLDIKIDPVAAEATDENNSAVRWVKVLPDKVRVAAYSGTPSWDFQYLRNALARTTYVRLESGILPPDGKSRLPLSERQLLEQDVLILADVPAAALSDVQWDAVSNFVARGGSIVLIAGDHCPSEYTGRIQSGLLPFQQSYAPAWRVWPGESPSFRFIRTPQGENFPALRLNAADDSSSSEGGPDRWQQLPGFYRFLPVPLSELRSHATPLLVEAESRATAGLDPAGPSNELALLTEWSIGLGHSYFFGARESWRWRMKVGEQDQDRFWVQLVRAAAGEPFAARSGALSLDLSRVAAEPDQPVNARVRVADESANPDEYSLEVLRAGQLVRTLPLTPLASHPDALPPVVTIPGLKEGEYEVRLVGPGGQSVAASLSVGQSYEAELSDISPDPGLLRRLAESSGGEFVTLDHVARLPQRIAALTDERMRYVEHPLWHSPMLFAFVIACFVAEWALRKRLGLA